MDVTAAAAVGGILGTVGYDALTRRFSLGDLMRGLIIETFTHLSLALTRIPAFALVIFFIFGAHAFVWGTTATTIRQRPSPTSCTAGCRASTAWGSSAASWWAH